MDPIMQWMADRGWNLDSPNERCARAIIRPPMLSQLSAEDAAGGHFVLVYLEFDRFLDRAPFDDMTRHVVAMKAGTWVVLRYENRDRVIDLEEANKRFADLQLWHDNRLVPARERFSAAIRGRDEAWVFSHREELEPAITQGLVERELGFFNSTEDDMMRMSLGVAMNDQGTNRPRGVNVLSFDEFMGYFEFCNSPTTTVSRWDDDGIARVDPLSVKTILDRIHRTKRAPGPVDPATLVDIPDFAFTPALEAQHAEALAAFALPQATRAARGKHDRAALAVRTHLRELLIGTTSIRQLSKRTDISRKALQAALEIEKQRMHRRNAG